MEEKLENLSAFRENKKFKKKNLVYAPCDKSNEKKTCCIDTQFVLNNLNKLILMKKCKKLPSISETTETKIQKKNAGPLSKLTGKSKYKS